MSAEVLFGALSWFGIDFAEELAEVLDGAAPNAIHHFAGAVLDAGGTVWTTNVDRCVETACEDTPRRAGRAAHLALELFCPLTQAEPGMLVKFHGSVENVRTLAFTDRQLLAPLPADAAAHLADLAKGRRVVLYGYAGADADLFDLLERVLQHADEVLWFEPFGARRHAIERAFPYAQIRFAPVLSGDQPAGAAITATGEAFAELAERVGAPIDPALRTALSSIGALPEPPQLSLKRPPGLTHARLVERFGAAGDDARALRTARREDFRRLRVRTIRGHLRWTINNSLYHGGGAAHLVDWLGRHRGILGWLPPRRLRDYVITRECALRLQRRDWRELDDFASWAVGVRDNPSDLYYRAQARRYALLVTLAQQDADAAAAGLSAAEDPERHAGAVLEQGTIAIYQGRFDRALREAFELRERTGRYAIARWPAWGAWLEAIALCYLQRPDDARAALDAARARFVAERRRGPIADVRTAELLAARVEIALGGSPDLSLEMDDAIELGGRYLDDRLLVAADLRLAQDAVGKAERLLHQVADAPSCPVAKAWAEFGLAEVSRRTGTGAADAFAAIAVDAKQRGAHWLHAQAAIGLGLCCDDRAVREWRSLPTHLRGKDEHPGGGVGDPRVLWMMTT
jgi:hypothetical protein